MPEKKPYKIWPVVIGGVALAILLGAGSNPTLSSGAFVGTLIAAGIIYRKNVKTFGKEYWKQ